MIEASDRTIPLEQPRVVTPDPEQRNFDDLVSDSAHTYPEEESRLRSPKLSLRLALLMDDTSP